MFYGTEKIMQQLFTFFRDNMLKKHFFRDKRRI